MVLCKFFQHGNCRFGTKCNNEHFDLKQIIKTDIEAAINGKQWPFSAYGPFKDKPCIVNFIEDQSFEEVRYLCYESKKRNFYEQFHQQFNNEANEATSKMKALLALTPDVLEILAQLYDTPVDYGKATKSLNPFATNAGSIYVKPTNNVGSIFSSGFNNQTATGSIFGGGLTNTLATDNTIFGGSSGMVNLFQAPNIQPQNSMFAQHAVKSTNNIFGGSVQTENQFHQAQPVSTTGDNLFASAVQQPDIFLQAGQHTTRMIDMGQQQPQFPSGGNIFRQEALATQSSMTSGSFYSPSAQKVGGSNLFAHTATQLPQHHPQSNIFAQANHTFESPTPQTASFQPALQHTAMMPSTGNQTEVQKDLTNAAAYSRMDDLTAEEMAAFTSGDAFQPGQIPLCPPARELVS